MAEIEWFLMVICMVNILFIQSSLLVILVDRRLNSKLIHGFIEEKYMIEITCQSNHNDLQVCS